MSVKTNPFRTLQILHRALLLGQILFSILAFILVSIGFGKQVDEKLDRILQVVTVLYSLAVFFIGANLFKKKLLEIKQGNLSPAQKMEQYRAACIIQWALLESASLFSIIAYLVTHNFSFLALVIFLLFTFGGLNPFKNKVMLQLGLSSQEADALSNMEN